MNTNILKKIVILTSTLSISGCVVTQEDVSNIIKACEHHGGFKLYSLFPTDVYCNDGTVIKTFGKGDESE